MGRSQDVFYRWLVPRVVLPLSERLGGRRLWTEVSRLRQLQWQPHEALEARAVEKLRRLLAHATAHVPYYRDLCKRAGIEPEDIRTLSDLAAIPLTTKADLRHDFPMRTTADNLPASRRRKMMTSGSTGLPFEFYWDRCSADVLFGAYLFSLEWAGVAIWDTQVAIASPAYFYQSIVESTRLRQLTRRLLLGEHTVRLSAVDLTASQFRALVPYLSRRGRYFMRSYPSTLAHLAAQLMAEGIELPKPPAVVMAYAETLTETNRASISRALRCRVINYYASWEVPQMAQTCPDNPAVLHVNCERVILRVVRQDGTPTPPGETGRVVVTDLANYVMPFINYTIGDYAVAATPCPCGRGLPTLATLAGRDTEVLRTPGGKQINGGVLGQFLAFVMGGIQAIWEYQAVQNTLDDVTLRVVPTARFTPEFATTLKRELEVFLGPGVRVALDCVERIPLEPSGKRLIIRSHLAQGQ